MKKRLLIFNGCGTFIILAKRNGMVHIDVGNSIIELHYKQALKFKRKLKKLLNEMKN
ncbi:MAG: hypothetical protein WC220_14585 [Pedobacter sp.]|jgi:hypothetical protein